MITDCQVRKLMKLLNQEQTLSLAAAKSGMDEKTARKYRRLRKLPSEMNKERDWRTREDSFKEMWEKVRSKLELNPGLQGRCCTALAESEIRLWWWPRYVRA